MKDMLHRNHNKDTPPVRATVNDDRIITIIMQSDMAKAFPDIAIAMIGKCREEAFSTKSNRREMDGD